MTNVDELATIQLIELGELYLGFARNFGESHLRLAADSRCNAWPVVCYDGEMNANDYLCAAPPKRANGWKLKTRRLEFARLPRLMGIVNVTPDSFSDGGKFAGVEAAVEQGLRLADAGADILDVGGESTRPYSQPVEEREELQRVLKVVQNLSEKCDIPVSIDTSKAVVAAECVAAGAEIINDVTGLEGDPAMLGVARDSGAGVCVMHMQGNPQTMQDAPAYTDVVADIREYLRVRRDGIVQAGLELERVCLDPGIGFGKTHQHNLTLMTQCGQFHELGRPLLVGHSRKGFFGRILGDKEADRDAATAGAAIALAVSGIQVIRVHNVKLVRDTLLGFAAARGWAGHELEPPNEDGIISG